MKITRMQLRRIIQEEARKQIVSEQTQPQAGMEEAQAVAKTYWERLEHGRTAADALDKLSKFMIENGDGGWYFTREISALRDEISQRLGRVNGGVLSDVLGPFEMSEDEIERLLRSWGAPDPIKNYGGEEG